MRFPSINDVSTELPATIHERGNGLPGPGEYVPGTDGNLYRVISVNGRIQTGRPGEANWVRATVELADWDDCPEEDEFPAEVVIDDEPEEEMNEARRIDPDAYSVYDYRTGKQLPGVPTEELAEESLSTEEGAVLATYDPDSSTWDLVNPEDRERIERRGDQVRTVYVMEDEE